METGAPKKINPGSLLLALALAVAAAACSDRQWPADSPDPDGGRGDGAENQGDGLWSLCAIPAADEDGDGIPNSLEGCLRMLDSDGDKVPDWRDLDSDNDKVPDSVEKGAKDLQGECAGGTPPANGWPCDTDGDRLPDYQDRDSDGDGLMDGDEDLNFDGKLGCCLTRCHTPGSKLQQQCQFTQDGCGEGQACVAGTCSPPADFNCAKGESDARKKCTFYQQRCDDNWALSICRAQRSKLQIRRSVAGDWSVALSSKAKFTQVSITKAPPGMTAAAFDHQQVQEETAGFIITRQATTNTLQQELDALFMTFLSKLPANFEAMYTISSGTRGKTHDLYDTVRESVMDIRWKIPVDVSTARNQLLAALLGKTTADLGNKPQGFSVSHSRMVWRFSAVWRFGFKKDGGGKILLDDKGFPMDSGNPFERRLVIMGAVAEMTKYQDSKLGTYLVVDDLSGGTALARLKAFTTHECEVTEVERLPVADIIWVMDESGSMQDNRKNMVNNASNFFSRALSSGLDFRLGVTNVCDPSGSYKAVVGKFCSQISTTSTDMGGADRFLMPSEKQIFEACVNNPPGYEGGSEYGLVNAMAAVKNHLPRQANAPQQIRPEAQLVVIVATDEYPQSMASIIGYANSKICILPTATQTTVNSGVLPYLNLFSGLTDPEAAAVFHVIGGVCNNVCGADMAHGYKELAQKLGGQVMDVCQKDLGQSMQGILDNVLGQASSIKLKHTPINASLVVGLNGQEVPRSRVQGFDFRPAGNSLVLLNYPYKKGSEVAMAYERWRQ